MKYNIYCDESCHLQHDGNDIMVIGGVFCLKHKVGRINKDIRKLKEKYDIKNAEIKWHKVSNNKVDFYTELIEYFFSNEDLRFRCIIAPEKKGLNLEKYSLTYDDWYYRIYYLLLKEIVSIDDEYYIYMDIKDTNGGIKINKLKKVLNNLLYAFYNDVVKNIQLVRSDEIEVIQLSDILIGAVSYVNRNLNVRDNAKSKIINIIMEKTSQSLKYTTTPKVFHNKFDIFRWKPKKQ